MAQHTTPPATPAGGDKPTGGKGEEAAKPLANNAGWLRGLRGLYEENALEGTTGKEEDDDPYAGLDP